MAAKKPNVQDGNPRIKPPLSFRNYYEGYEIGRTQTALGTSVRTYTYKGPRYRPIPGGEARKRQKLISLLLSLVACAGGIGGTLIPAAGNAQPLGTLPCMAAILTAGWVAYTCIITLFSGETETIWYHKRATVTIPRMSMISALCGLLAAVCGLICVPVYKGEWLPQLGSAAIQLAAAAMMWQIRRMERAVRYEEIKPGKDPEAKKQPV